MPERVDYPDSTTLTGECAGGALATIVSSVAVWQFYRALTIVARDLHLRLIYDAWTINGIADGKRIDEHIPTTGYPEQIDAFLIAIERQDQSSIRSSYRDAVGTFAATLAANASLHSGRTETVEFGNP